MVRCTSAVSSLCQYTIVSSSESSPPSPSSSIHWHGCCTVHSVAENVFAKKKIQNLELKTQWRCLTRHHLFVHLSIRYVHLPALFSQQIGGDRRFETSVSTTAHSLSYTGCWRMGVLLPPCQGFYCRVGWRIKIDWVCSKDDKSLEDTIVGVGGCDYLQWGILSNLK